MFFRLTPFYILNHAFIDNTALSTFLPAVENQRQNIFLLLLNNYDAYFWYVKLKMPDLLHSKLVFLKNNLLTQNFLQSWLGYLNEICDFLINQKDIVKNKLIFTDNLSYLLSPLFILPLIRCKRSNELPPQQAAGNMSPGPRIASPKLARLRDQFHFHFNLHCLRFQRVSLT